MRTITLTDEQHRDLMKYLSRSLKRSKRKLQQNLDALTDPWLQDELIHNSIKEQAQKNRGDVERKEELLKIIEKSPAK